MISLALGAKPFFLSLPLLRLLRGFTLTRLRSNSGVNFPNAPLERDAVAVRGG